MRERKPSSVMSSCGILSTGVMRAKIVVGTYKLVLAARDVGNVHVVGRGRQVFHLLRGEDVDGDHVDFGVTVLAGLRGRHLDNLAGAALDDNVTVLPQSRTLHGKGGGGTGIGALESVLMLRSV